MPCCCESSSTSIGALSGVDGGECDKLFNIGTTAEEVDRLKSRLLAIADTMDRDVFACTTLDQNKRSAWQDFFNEFSAFATEPTDFWGSYQAWTQACSYAHQIDAWQEQLAASCKLSSPTNTKGADKQMEVFKWGSAAVIGIAVVVGLLLIKSYVPSFGGKRR